MKIILQIVGGVFSFENHKQRVSCCSFHISSSIAVQYVFLPWYDFYRGKQHARIKERS